MRNLLESYVSNGIFSPNDPHLDVVSLFCHDLFSHYSDLDKETRQNIRVVPPFEKMFLQFTITFETSETAGIGMFIFCRRVVDPSSEVQWLLDIELWGDAHVHVFEKSPMLIWHVNLTSDGALAGDSYDMSLSPLGLQYLKETADDEDEAKPEDLNLILNCCIFALNLLNCKNIVMQEAPLSHRQKRNIRMGKPAYRYHVLKLRRGKKLYDFQQESDGKGSKKALHMCRGHFKTFTEEAPLMGKFVGTYYWGSFIRGRDKDHVVDKDYELLESEAS